VKLIFGILRSHVTHPKPMHFFEDCGACRFYIGPQRGGIAMNMWRTEQETGVPRPPGKKRWSLLNPLREDGLIVAAIVFLYLSLLAWPLYNLATDAGSPSGNFTLLAGMLGLILAAYAAIADHVRTVFRLPLGATGIAMVIGFWGFGPL
jgi:hypothetical protein